MVAIHLRLEDLRHQRRARDVLQEKGTLIHATALMVRPAIEAAGEDRLPHTRLIAERAMRRLPVAAALQDWALDPWPGHNVLSVAGIVGTELAECRYLVDPDGRVHGAPDPWRVLSDRQECRLPESDDWWRGIFEPLAAQIDAGWRATLDRLLAQYATPPGAWWAIRLDWTIDPARADAIVDVIADMVNDTAVESVAAEHH